MWKVFVPDEVLIAQSGFLCGQIHHDIHMMYIAGVQHKECCHGKQVIGIWSNGKKTLELQSDYFVELSDDGYQLKCTLKLNGQSAGSVSCIVYNKDQLRHSSLVEPMYECDDDSIMCRLQQCIHQDCKQSSTITDYIFKLFQAFRIIYIKLSGERRFLKIGWLPEPAIIEIIHSKYSQLIECLQSKSQHSCKNISSRQVLDSSIGMVLMFLLMNYGLSQAMSDSILNTADSITVELTKLLNWLMGAPAGLKLNTHLTQCLGYIFLYHIYLWKGYLYLIQPYLCNVLLYSSCVGVLGVTAQISLLQDILSIMTFHVYCFYVYAARLYRLQLYTLSALWRLFRGRKWNILRGRVDSTSFDVDQLFIGTLMFTIFLFLLPTTLLYYIVFTMLRLLVLIVQGLLCKIVHFLSEIPVCDILLWIFNSNEIKCDVLFHVMRSEKNPDSRYFSMQLLRPSFSKLASLSKPSMKKTRKDHVWSHFINSLIKGHLIYPWMESS